MHKRKPLRATVHGRFAILTADGAEVCLTGSKERALLAMLVLSPDQSRSRAWLQDRLWSRSPPERGAANLRRVLSNIRRALGPNAACFLTNRTTVRLDPAISIIPDAPPGAALLDDVDGLDPEFDDWLTGMRAHAQEEEPGTSAPWVRRQARQVARIRVESDVLSHSREATFAAENLAARLAARLNTLGPVEVELDHEGLKGEPQPGDGPDTLIRIQGIALGDQLQFHSRIQRVPSLQFCGTYRARVPVAAIGAPMQTEIAGLINRTVMTVLDVNAPMGRSRPFYAIQNAVRRIYSGNREDLEAADDLLKSAQQSDAAGIALAWRAFLRLTLYVEFLQDRPSLAEEAVSMSEEATRLSPRNAIVWSLASQIAVYLAGDYERGMYYARRAEACADEDPYTLDALSSAATMNQDRAAAFELAERGRKAAEGLDNVYNWDMQCCLSAIHLERLEVARTYAQDCHWKMPGYRPALRYLVALSLLTGNRAAADTYSARLKKLEPAFEHSSLCDEDYPVMTLRNLGMIPQIRSAIAA